MNKKIILGLCIAGAILGACNSKQREEKQKREQEYKALLDKEYAEFPNTELAKLFEERYKALLALTEELNASDSLESMEGTKLDSLCFESFEGGYTYDDGSTAPIPYKDYQNRNLGVNAVFVTSEFFKKDKAANKFSDESKLHKAYKALNKDSFILECSYLDTAASYIYPEFCSARLDMERLAHVRYFVILKQSLFSKWKIFGSSTESLGDFFPGIYMANVVVYDAEQKKTVYVTSFFAMNSETVKYMEGSEEVGFSSDLEGNIKKEMEHKMDSVIGIKGTFPLLFMNLRDAESVL